MKSIKSIDFILKIVVFPHIPHASHHPQPQPHVIKPTFGVNRFLHDLMRDRAGELQRDVGGLRGQREQQRPDAGDVRIDRQAVGQVPDDHGTVVRSRRNHTGVAVDGQTVDVTGVLRQRFDARSLLVPDLNFLIEAARYQQCAGAVKPVRGRGKI